MNCDFCLRIFKVGEDHLVYPSGLKGCTVTCARLSGNGAKLIVNERLVKVKVTK